MRFLWDFIILLSILVWLIGLASQGVIPLKMVALALIGFVFFRALGRAQGGMLSRLIRMLFKIGIPLTSLLVFAVLHGKGDVRDVAGILGVLGALFIILVGFYVTFYGFFSSSKRK